MDMFNRYALVRTILDTVNMPSHVICEAESLDEMMKIIEDVDHPSTPFRRMNGFDKILAIFAIELYPRMLWDSSIGDMNLMPARLSGPVCLGHMYFASQGPYSPRPVEEYTMEDIMEHDGQFSYAIYAIPDEVSERSASSMLDEDGYTGYDGYEDDPYVDDDGYFDDDGYDRDAHHNYEANMSWDVRWDDAPVPKSKVSACKASRDLKELKCDGSRHRTFVKKQLRRHDRRQTKHMIEHEMMAY